MNKALVDVPVQINIWIREECQTKQFEIIRKARPSIIFLQSDGGRNKTEWETIYKNRKLYDEGIDWECKVYKIYEDKNNGMYAMSRKMMDFVWNKVDRCIFLEDDILPSVSYFRFCAELLERYKDDLRISYISGMNYYVNYKDPTYDYFFAGETCIWGIAMWRRTYMSQNMNFEKNAYMLRCIKQVCKKAKKGYEKIIEGYIKDRNYMGHVPHVEFYKQLLRFSQNQLSIVPKKNMIHCIGVTQGSVHSSDNIHKLPWVTQRLFFMKTYEVDFPLKHPEYVVRDIKYDRYVNYVLGWKSNPIVYFSRKVERFIRCIIYGDWEKIRSGLKNQVRMSKEN